MPSFFNFTKTVMKNLFSKPVSTSYPNVPFEYKERTRGHIENELDKCIFCGICEKKCPTGTISVTKEPKSWSINHFDCVQCNCCAEVCPKKCLHMKNDYTKPETTKTKEVFSHA